MVEEGSVEDQVFSIFSELASTLGYSPIHGKIIGALLVAGKPISLQELSARVRYSAGMVSLSLDLLEVLGVVKKVKKPGDRKLYVQMEGDLLEALKKAVIIKVKKGIDESLRGLGARKGAMEELGPAERKAAARTIAVLEGEIKRLEKYVNLLSEIRLP